MQLLIPDWPGLPDHIGACTTLRGGGVSLPPFDDGQGGGGLNIGVHVGDDPQAVRHNRAALQRILPRQPAWLRQVHGTTVVDAASCDDEAEGDASVATQSGIVCAIQTADCLPVLLCDGRARVVGAAHAGWRGLAAGVLQATVSAMRARGASEISAWLGPAIGPQQFEVGQDVVDAFAHLVQPGSQEWDTAFLPHPTVTGKYFAHICQLARLVLAQHGVLNVAGGEYCTVSDAQRFYSYRRDQRTGRMVSCIWLK